MMNKTRFYLMFFSFLILTSCGKMDSTEKTTELSVFEKKFVSDDYFKNYWVNATNQMLTENKDHFPALKELNEYLKSEFRSIESSKSQLLQFGLSLANTFDEESFLRLFCNKYPSHYLIITTGPRCTVCEAEIMEAINILKTDIYLYTREDYSQDTPDCNCSWTCGEQIAECTLPSCSEDGQDYCCNATSIGCGFLFLMSCDGYDTLDPSNCP